LQSDLGDVIRQTIAKATNQRIRGSDGSSWWYDAKTKTVVYVNPTMNSFGDHGTVFKITTKNYVLPDGTVVNPSHAKLPPPRKSSK
jgi:hypothetical protein